MMKVENGNTLTEKEISGSKGENIEEFLRKSFFLVFNFLYLKIHSLRLPVVIVLVFKKIS